MGRKVVEEAKVELAFFHIGDKKMPAEMWIKDHKGNNIATVRIDEFKAAASKLLLLEAGKRFATTTEGEADG